MTSTITAPDQTERAQAVIEQMLALDNRANDRLLARLVAACIHRGPETALYRFAAEDELSVDLYKELTSMAPRAKGMTKVGQVVQRRVWIGALEHFLLVEGLTL